MSDVQSIAIGDFWLVRDMRTFELKNCYVMRKVNLQCNVAHSSTSDDRYGNTVRSALKAKVRQFPHIATVNDPVGKPKV
jgi:hypothetical protein